MNFPAGYIETPEHIRSERTRAAEEIVVGYLKGKTKISLRAAADEPVRHPFVVYVDELNRELRARGFEGYSVEHRSMGQLTLVQDAWCFEMRGETQRPPWAR